MSVNSLTLFIICFIYLWLYKLTLFNYYFISFHFIWLYVSFNATSVWGGGSSGGASSRDPSWCRPSFVASAFTPTLHGLARLFFPLFSRGDVSWGGSFVWWPPSAVLPVSRGGGHSQEEIENTFLSGTFIWASFKETGLCRRFLSARSVRGKCTTAGRSHDLRPCQDFSPKRPWCGICWVVVIFTSSLEKLNEVHKVRS